VDTMTNVMMNFKWASTWFLVQLYEDTQSSAHTLLCEPTKSRSLQVREALGSVVGAAVLEHDRVLADFPELTASSQQATKAAQFCKTKVVGLNRPPVSPRRADDSRNVAGAASTAIVAEVAAAVEADVPIGGPWKVTVQNILRGVPAPAVAMTLYSSSLRQPAKRERVKIKAGDSHTFEGETDENWYGEVPGDGEYHWNIQAGYHPSNHMFTNKNYSGYSPAGANTGANEIETQTTGSPLASFTDVEVTLPDVDSSVLDQCCEICGCAPEEVRRIIENWRAAHKSNPSVTEVIEQILM
jgi:hypothetical protein